MAFAEFEVSKCTRLPRSGLCDPQNPCAVHNCAEDDCGCTDDDGNEIEYDV